MKNKILLGSIAAVIVIVLASYTSVVGFQSTKLKHIRVSPVFDIRAKRAIEKESHTSFTCDYIGKESMHTLVIPSRNSNGQRAQKIIETIAKMNDHQIEELVNLILQYQQKDDGLNDINVSKITYVLHYIKDNPEKVKDVLLHNNDIALSDCIIITILLSIIIEILFFIYVILMTLFWCPFPTKVC